MYLVCGLAMAAGVVPGGAAFLASGAMAVAGHPRGVSATPATRHLPPQRVTPFGRPKPGARDRPEDEAILTNVPRIREKSRPG